MRIEAVDKTLPESSERPVLDTPESYSVQQMARAWATISKPIPEEHVRLSAEGFTKAGIRKMIARLHEELCQGHRFVKNHHAIFNMPLK